MPFRASPQAVFATGVLLALTYTAPVFARTIVVTAPSDGTTNAAPAINAALSGATSGDIVQLPAGHYAVAGSITLHDGVTLEGAGIGTTTLIATGTHQTVVDFTGTHHATLRALSIDGNGTHADNGIGGDTLTFALVDTVEVFHLTNSGIFGPFGVYFSSGVDDSIVRHCRFHDIGSGSNWGVAVRFESSHRALIEDNTSVHTGRGGYHIKLTSDAVIRRNTAHDFLPMSDALGIEAFQACDRVVIEDNEIDSWLSLDSTPLAAVRRNHVEGMMTTHAGPYGLEVVASPDVVMTDNIVRGPLAGGTGVSVDSTQYLQLERNVIDGVTGTFVELQTNTGTGRLDTSAIYAYRNQYLNAPARAIHAHGIANGLVFDQDVARTWGDTAFFVQTSRVLLDHVTLENTGTQSGYFSDSTEDYVRGCTGNRCPAFPPAVAVPTPSPLPSAAFDAVATMMNVAVDASTSTDPGGSALHYLWDFGEGPAVSARTASHTYASAGLHSIVLIVWNSHGWGARAEHTVMVGTSSSDAGADASTNLDAANDADGPDAGFASDVSRDVSRDAGMTGRNAGCGCRTTSSTKDDARVFYAAALLAAFQARRRRRNRTAPRAITPVL